MSKTKQIPKLRIDKKAKTTILNYGLIKDNIKLNEYINNENIIKIEYNKLIKDNEIQKNTNNSLNDQLNDLKESYELILNNNNVLRNNNELLKENNDLILKENSILSI